VRAYLGERRFNKGIMNIYIQNGLLIFRDLEISNRNILGITDLSVKVAPLNNRIAIDHLMWTITEAAQRAKKTIARRIPMKKTTQVCTLRFLTDHRSVCRNHGQHLFS